MSYAGPTETMTCTIFFVYCRLSLPCRSNWNGRLIFGLYSAMRLVRARTLSVFVLLRCSSSVMGITMMEVRSGFLGLRQSMQYKWRRHYATKTRITMMPEGPEVRTFVDQLQGGVGKRLVDIRFLSGRYVRNGKPDSFQAFAKTMSPTFQPHSQSPQETDIIQSWNAKGKFMYIVLDDGSNMNPRKRRSDDFQRSIWITLGMTGQFVNEQVHQQDPRFVRWCLDIMDVASNEFRKVSYLQRCEQLRHEVSFQSEVLTISATLPKI